MDRNRHFDQGLLFVILALMGFGLIMVYSASSITSLTEMLDGQYYFKRQLLFVFLGLISMFVFSNIHYRKLENIAVPLLLTSICFLILVLFAQKIGGAHRWLRIGGLGFQPSELAKIAFLIYMAHSISTRQDRITELVRGILPDLGVMLVVFLLILKEPNLSTAAIIASTYFMMLFLGNGSIAHLAWMGVSGATMVVALIFQEGYRMRRLLAFLDPWGASKTAGYHIIQSLVAIGSGGLWGLGLGQSRQKFFILPERHTDFIYAIVCEELGLIGGLFVLVLFFILIWRGFYIAMRAPDLFGFLLASGITCLVATQGLINLGVVLSLFPTTGVTLPFISTDCSKTEIGCPAYNSGFHAIGLAEIQAVDAIAMGILLNISRFGSNSHAMLDNRRRPFSQRLSAISDRSASRRRA
ncbi:MAG: putative lipid II flippase FtsW [Candidatus Riflebacteria bacterium]|nr:putative lipid II flippase FtsW [Candidatus Riflebacteria bacterium]